jgi:hypothetical protein
MVNISEDGLRRLVVDRGDADHPYENTTSSAKEHIHDEPKAADEGRKNCPGAQPTYVVQIEGKIVEMPPLACTCPGTKCISPVECRSTVIWVSQEEGGEKEGGAAR